MKNKDIYIYGAGSTGKKIAGLLLDSGYRVKNFIDRSDTKKEPYLGIETIQPASIKIENPDKSVVIVAVFNRDFDISKVIFFCKELGFQHILTLFELIDYFLEKELNFYWLSNQERNKISRQVLDNCLGLFKDELSRSIFNETVQARMQRNMLLLPEPAPLSEQYFSANVPLHSCKSFIDIGAYDGDSIEGLKERFGKIENYVALEPDINNYQQLVSKVRSDRFYERAFLYPCASWSVNEILRMNAGEGEASACSSTGNTFIQAVALDDIIAGMKPDYIKMDIEGAELEALYGAKKTIYAYKPDLAICLYHTPEHLYQIPMLIDSWNLGYKFYCRQYGYCGFDLVLYAISE